MFRIHMYSGSIYNKYFRITWNNKRSNNSDMFFTEVSRQTHTVMPADFFPKRLYSVVIITRCFFFTVSGIKNPPVHFQIQSKFSFWGIFLPGSYTEVYHYNSLTSETFSCKKNTPIPRDHKHHKGILLKPVLATRADCNEKNKTILKHWNYFLKC